MQNDNEKMTGSIFIGSEHSHNIQIQHDISNTSDVDNVDSIIAYTNGCGQADPNLKEKIESIPSNDQTVGSSINRFTDQCDRPHYAMVSGTSSNCYQQSDSSNVKPYNYSYKKGLRNNKFKRYYHHNKQKSWLKSYTNSHSQSHFNKSNVKIPWSSINSSTKEKKSFQYRKKYFNKSKSICDSNPSADPGDLQKLEMMTAVDFDRDRYARYSIHESEIKDYVRTVTYKNCIEYCSEHYIKVNINYISSLTSYTILVKFKT